MSINPNQSRVILVNGPLSLTLDSDQIYVDEPGLGTPMLLEHKVTGETMTWECGYNGGNWNEIFPQKADFAKYQAWLDSIAEEVEAWEAAQWEKAESEKTA